MSSTLVPITIKDGDPPVWFEIPDDEPQPADGTDFVLAGNTEDAKPVPRSLDAALDTVRPLVSVLFEKLSAGITKPKEIELSIGVKLSGKVGFFVAESQGEGSIEIKLKW